MPLKVEGIKKTFGDKVAVRGVSFDAEPGVFGLIGTNGAGKTTTIRIMLGIMRADAGRALWNGQPITRENTRFGYMPEERGLYMKARVLEQLVYFGMLRGMTRPDAQKSALRLLERLGLKDAARMTAEKLSKGNQQKVQLIATLIHDPDLIVLDEPFSGLDPLNTESLSELIEEMRAAGKTIVMSSHQMNTVETYCQNVLMLHHGDTVLHGSLADIKAGYGHTNLVCRVPGHEQAARDMAVKCGLTWLKNDPAGDEYRIAGDDMAKRLLKSLVEAGLYPVAFQIREPSLHEIFIEKTTVSEGGDAQ